jgi:hypothetical protein
MLLSAEFDLFTDYKNRTYSSTTNQQVIRQLNYLEDFSPKYDHIPGENNFLANAFSWLPCCEDLDYASEEEKERLTNIKLDSFHTSTFDDHELSDCFLNLPDLNYEPFPLYFQHIAQGQQADQQLLQQRMLHPLQYPSQFFQGLETISYRPAPTTAWRFCIPNNQLLALVRWYHQVLGHPGIHCLRDSMATHFYHLHLRATVNDVIKHCEACQINKLTGPGYGQLPS